MTNPVSLESLDLSTPHGVAVARNRYLRPAKAEKDYSAVDRILSVILEAQPTNLRALVERFDNAAQMGEMGLARSYLDALTEQVPELEQQVDPQEAILLLRSLLIIDDVDRAVSLADSLLGTQQDAQLGLFLVKVYDAAGRIDRILQLSEDLYRQAEGRPDIRARLLTCLVDSGYTSRTFALLGNDLVMDAENVDVVLQASRAYLRAYPTDPRGLELLEDAYAFTPDREDIRISLSKAYLQFGRAKDALEILELDPKQPVQGKESWRQHVAEVFVATNNFAEAGEIYRELARENPLHSGWRRAGIGALIQAGEGSKATAMYEEDRMRRRLSAHDRFEDRLRALDGKLDEADIPPVRFDWAYRKLEQLGAAPDDRKAWEDATRRVYLADLLTIDWLETRPADTDQLLDRFRSPEASIQPIVDCLESGDGAFICTLHLGSMFAGPALLNDQGVDFRWLASTPAISAMPGGDKLLSTSSTSALANARSVFRAIRSGSAILVAIDGGVPSVSRPMPFLGDDVLVTDMVPRTVLQTGARSFFPKVAWVGDELSLEFVELIPPSPGESLEDYTSVWFRDFFECVADFCREHPDNMRLAGGFWTQLAL